MRERRTMGGAAADVGGRAAWRLFLAILALQTPRLNAADAAQAATASEAELRHMAVSVGNKGTEEVTADAGNGAFGAFGLGDLGLGLGLHHVENEAKDPEEEDRGSAIEDVVERLDGADYARERFGKDFLEFMTQLKQTLVNPTPELVTDIALLQNDLKMLDNSLNGIINKAREAADTLKDKEERLQHLQVKQLDEAVIKSVLKGRARVDYKTGIFRPSEVDSVFMTALVDPDQQQTSVHVEMDETLRKRLEELQKEIDPAMLHLDVQFLQDFVILVLAGAACGILVTMLGRLTSSIGFIFGGMVVGPSGLNLIHDIVAVQTLSQVGAVFLLFSHGVDYARKHARSWRNVLQQAMGPTVVLLALCTVLLGMLASIAEATRTYKESIVFALGATFSSTALLNEGIRVIGSSHMPFQLATLQAVMACQDLLMVPTLALPGIFFNSWGDSFWEKFQNLFKSVMSIASAAIVVITISRHILPIVVAKLDPKATWDQEGDGHADAPAQGAHHGSNSKSSRTGDADGLDGSIPALPSPSLPAHSADLVSSRQLLTISIAAYALLVSLMSERIGLSPEAGALLAGLAISDRHTIQAAHIATDPLTSLFGGIYLSSLGMLVSPKFIYLNLRPLTVMVVFIFGAKLGLTFFLLRRLKVEESVSLPASILFAQVSELCLFYVSRAEGFGQVTRHAYLTFLACTVIFQGLAPLILGLAFMVRRQGSPSSPSASHAYKKSEAAPSPPLLHSGSPNGSPRWEEDASTLGRRFSTVQSGAVVV